MKAITCKVTELSVDDDGYAVAKLEPLGMVVTDHPGADNYHPGLSSMKTGDDAIVYQPNQP